MLLHSVASVCSVPCSFCEGVCGVLSEAVRDAKNMQAMEAIKVACDHSADAVMSGRMLMYTAATCTFRNIRLRQRRADCAICGDDAAANRDASQLRQEPLTRGPLDACASEFVGIVRVFLDVCAPSTSIYVPNSVSFVFVCARERVCVYVCMCVCERERECAYACVSVCV